MDGTKVSGAAFACSSEISDIPWTVIWPCDIQPFLDAQEVVQYGNYILDDVSIQPPTSFPSLNPLALSRISRKFWSIHSQLGLG